MVKALASADLRAKLAGTDSVATSSTPEELRKRHAEWGVIFGKIAKEAGLKREYSAGGVHPGSGSKTLGSSV